MQYGGYSITCLCSTTGGCGICFNKNTSVCQSRQLLRTNSDAANAQIHKPATEQSYLQYGSLFPFLMLMSIKAMSVSDASASTDIITAHCIAH